MNKENQETDYELYTVTSVEPVIKYKENQECKCRCHTADPLNQCYYVSKAREEERRKMLGKLTDEFYEFSTGKAWEAEQQEWVILHEPKEVIKRLTDAIKEME